ncbi:hypothetical protein [Saccharothrix syringae]|uniref:Uncharacterized protein n=1 Tax=Saccharothrix syringae TaxID=103733 RepID=A0A5Q0H223_SACSY|nr:hypothetical protein [Saccharothrix syringae]QFZ19860.1 hypothetical protein EKG83_22685 [Saccharothrix syringae]
MPLGVGVEQFQGGPQQCRAGAELIGAIAPKLDAKGFRDVNRYVVALIAGMVPLAAGAALVGWADARRRADRGNRSAR